MSRKKKRRNKNQSAQSKKQAAPRKKQDKAAAVAEVDAKDEAPEDDVKIIEVDIAAPEEEAREETASDKKDEPGDGKPDQKEKEEETKEVRKKASKAERPAPKIEEAASVIEPSIIKVISKEEADKRAVEKLMSVSEVSIDMAASLLDGLVDIEYLFSRVREDAIKKLFELPLFAQLFEECKARTTVILAIDVHRSMSMMLNAKTPLLYMGFMSALSDHLRDIVIDNYGVFDKFIGNGLVAFFPEFYSGDDALCHALKAADECEEFFKMHYRQHRACFNTVYKDAGLGIGIDYGQAHVIKRETEISAVGRPVVYASRLSGAGGSNTLINQAAFDALLERHDGKFQHEEIGVSLGSEGEVITYQVKFDWHKFKPQIPDWDMLVERTAD